MQEPSHILFEKIAAKQGHIGLITLNRPQALNALSGVMILALHDQLQKWAEDSEISLVMIRSSTNRAFCAGGDLKEVYHYGTNKDAEGLAFYAEEYRLDLFINKYPKPYVAFLNGVTMGGGLGLCMHGSRIVASEGLMLAMPETGIGFFPDVGAGYFFQRCPHNLGMYLGLTGHIMNIAEAIYANLVQTYVPSSSVKSIFEQLIAQDLSMDPLGVFDAVLAGYQQDPPGGNELKKHALTIEECFSKNSVEQIIEALKAHDSWAKAQVKTLLQKSPTSLKITFKELTLAKNLDLKQCLAMEFKLAEKVFQQHDIYEGIRALLIDKTHDPKWKPATLQEVNDSAIEQLFN